MNDWTKRYFISAFIDKIKSEKNILEDYKAPIRSCCFALDCGFSARVLLDLLMVTKVEKKRKGEARLAAEKVLFSQSIF